MSSAAKLTKKQKKGLAFRQRKAGKGKPSNDDASAGLEDNGLPAMEVQDSGGEDDGDLEGQGVDAPAETEAMVKKGKQKQKIETVDQPVSKKRRREEEDVVKDKDSDPSPKVKGTASDPPKAKKRKTNADAEKKTNDQKFILFLGNLKYTTTKEAITAHFAKCDPPPSIRLLTPKASGGTKPTIKSKGCAFLEFTHRNALQQALKLHHSQLDGRMVNVELTAGGGGNGDSRRSKVSDRNKALFDQRKEKLEKDKDQDGIMAIERPQRFSSTSGLEQKPLKKRTWTIGDVKDDTVHRGGVKHKKKGGAKKKSWGTGVNSIPVG